MYVDLAKQIINRKKFGRLTAEQRNYLRILIRQPNISIEKISSMYLVIRNVLYSLKQGREYSNDWIKFESKFSISSINKPALCQIIHDFVVKTEIPIKAKDIQRMIIKNYDIEIPINRIISLMKEDINLSYK